MKDFLDIEFKITPKNIISLFIFITTLVGGWYAIESKIEEGRALPRPGTGQYFIDRNDNNATISWPPSRGEFDFKYNAILNKLETLENDFNEYKKNHTH